MVIYIVLVITFPPKTGAPQYRSHFTGLFQGRQPSVRRILGQLSSLQAALLLLVIYYVGEFSC